MDDMKYADLVFSLTAWSVRNSPQTCIENCFQKFQLQYDSLLGFSLCQELHPTPKYASSIAGGLCSL